jgi:hypothetical protein
LALALATASVATTFADTTTSTTPTTAPTCKAGGRHRHHHESVLSATEKAQLKKAREAALAANGTLQTQRASLKQQFQALRAAGSSTTQAQWQALHQQRQTYFTSLKAAELNIDPTLQPIFDKLAAAHKGHSSS